MQRGSVSTLNQDQVIACVSNLLVSLHSNNCCPREAVGRVPGAPGGARARGGCPWGGCPRGGCPWGRGNAVPGGLATEFPCKTLRAEGTRLPPAAFSSSYPPAPVTDCSRSLPNLQPDLGPGTSASARFGEGCQHADPAAHHRGMKGGKETPCKGCLFALELESRDGGRAPHAMQSDSFPV